MPPSFSPGIAVEYARARWRVLRVLGAESVLLGSDTGEEVAADPLKIRLPDGRSPTTPRHPSLDEPHYSEADWSKAERRRDVLVGLVSQPRATAHVSAAAESLG